MRRGASYASILLGKRVCQTGEPLRVGEEGGVDYDFMIFFIFSKCDSVVGGNVRFMIKLELKKIFVTSLTTTSTSKGLGVLKQFRI